MIDRRPAKPLSPESSSSTIKQSLSTGDNEDKEGSGEESDGSGSSLVEALAAARGKEAAEKATVDSSDKSQKQSKVRRNSLFNLFQKKEKEEEEKTEMAENDKPKLRQTSSHTLSAGSSSSQQGSSGGLNTTTGSAEVLRGFHSDGNLSNKTPPARPPPLKTTRVSNNVDAAAAEEKEKEDEATDTTPTATAAFSLPPTGQPANKDRARRSSMGFVRKMSRKVRNMGGKESEGDSDDDPDGSRISRQTSKKVEKPKPPRFEFIDLTMEDVPENPPIKKLTYAQLVGMSTTC